MATATAPKTSAPQTTVLSPESESLLDQVIANTCTKIDDLARKYNDAIEEAEGRISRAMLMANGIDKLRQALTPQIMAQFMALQGSRLGFLTDRDKTKDGGKGPGYPVEVVRECLIEALLNGVYPTGNMFNIIAGQCYITKEGYYHKVTTLDGLTDLDLIPGTPRGMDGNTVVKYAANWKWQGQKCELLNHEGKPGREFTIRVNVGMGPDAILGKATRKVLKAIYQKVTGTETTLPDAEVGEELLNQVIANTQQQQANKNTDGPAPGRSSFKNGNGAPVAAPEHATPQQAETTPWQASQDLPAPQDEGGWIEDWMSDMGERFLKATTGEELQVLGMEMMKQRTAIGEERYNKLLTVYRERYKAVVPEGPQAGQAGDSKPAKKK